MPPDEIWKPVVGYEGLYEVSNLGRVRSLGHVNWRGHVMTRIRQYTNKDRTDYYWTHLLKKDGKSNGYYVHRLVWLAFNGPIEGKKQIKFIDGDRDNCALDNLEMRANGHALNDQFRKQNFYGKGRALTKVQVDMVQSAPPEVSNISLARQFGVHYSTISLIRRGLRQKGKPK